MLLITHANLLAPGKVIADGALLIEDGRIHALGVAGEFAVPPEASVLDAQGAYLGPGFIDLQVNGGFGHDFTQDPESLWEVAAALPQYGVTSFLPTVITSPLEVVERALDVLRRGPGTGIEGAQPLGYHLEGPFLNPAKKGAHNPTYIQPPSLEAVAGWSKENGVLLATLAPEQNGALDVVRALREQGVVVSAGHSMATYAQAQDAFLAGVTYGTHLFNAMPLLNRREPGLVGALLAHPDIVTGLIVDGLHVHPAIVDVIWRAIGPYRLNLVSDAMAALGMPPGIYRLGDYDVLVDAESARLPDGTLAGSLLRLDTALRNLMTFTGCSLEQALPTLTSTPARLLGLEHKGRLALGADADLVLLTDGGEILATLVAGQVVFSHLDEFHSEVVR
jgi:N-acetylglucosamine-6-phosphate deacetylase